MSETIELHEGLQDKIEDASHGEASMQETTACTPDVDIVVAAALLNAFKVLGKPMGCAKIIINGADDVGCAIGNLLLNMGFGNVIMCGTSGAICEGDKGLTAAQTDISLLSNLYGERGVLADIIMGADVFVGLSGDNPLAADMVSTMNRGIVLAMEAPAPGIMPGEAKLAGAAVVCTGSGDFPNRIAGLPAGAPDIAEEMKEAVAYAIAALVPDDKLSVDFILPPDLDLTVANAIAAAVAGPPVSP